MPSRSDLRACRGVIRVHARSFSFASLFLPRDVRADVAVVYAYYRMLDDLVDDPPVGMGPSAVRGVLDDWDAWLATSGPVGTTDEPVRRALPEVIDRRSLDRDELRIVIRGLRRDLEHVRPATMAEVEGYSFEVAGSVGLVMGRLLGAPMPLAAKPAAALGTAMQLTNICRDVDEDLRRGRIYLPLDVCASAGCDDGSLRARQATPGVRAAVGLVAARAHQLYTEGTAGLGLLPAGSRFPIAVAARAYATILDRLARREHDVFAGRVAMSGRARWAMAARLAAARAVPGIGGRP
ncbi:MAG: phytoene/squalene synthase family protein [Candidatus Dormibacteria bacterium]